MAKLPVKNKLLAYGKMYYIFCCKIRLKLINIPRLCGRLLLLADTRPPLHRLRRSQDDHIKGTVISKVINIKSSPPPRGKNPYSMASMPVLKTGSEIITMLQKKF